MDNPGDLDARLAEMEKKFAGGPVPRPSHWSGFRITPGRIEFWRNMPSRLHVRHVYVRAADGWQVSQLFP
jgi:pyridoxamine 5'-phosphate oxidase